MPRFFFDIRDRTGFRRDAVGEDLATSEEAHDQAQALLSDLLRREVSGEESRVAVCDVRDETDRVVYRGKLTYAGEPS